MGGILYRFVEFRRHLNTNVDGCEHAGASSDRNNPILLLHDFSFLHPLPEMYVAHPLPEQCEQKGCYPTRWPFVAEQ